jgi:cellulose biosynthesis protein BcsQ
MMLRTISLCSGKGGVGKTLLSASLARIIQQAENCNVLAVDLDLSVSGLTLLSFHNKIELDQVPLSLFDYLTGDENAQSALFGALQAAVAPKSEYPSAALYQRLDHIFILPASIESERPDWSQFARIELDLALEKIDQLRHFVAESLDIDYLIFDTQAGLGSLSLAAATLSDMNIIVMEEDDISWSTSLRMFTEITELNKRLRHRSRSYFLANKAQTGLMDMATKLRAFAFLPPIPVDSWMQHLVSNSTAAVLEKEFENSDFFRHFTPGCGKKWPAFLDSVRVRQKRPRLAGGGRTGGRSSRCPGPSLRRRPRHAAPARASRKPSRTASHKKPRPNPGLPTHHRPD